MPPRQSQITRREALDALLRSGYLLESRVESLLRADKFYVEANSLVPDDSTGKMRELDVWASWGVGYTFGSAGEDGLQQGDIGLELIIECVHPPQPVAFLVKEQGDPLFQRTMALDAFKISGNPPENGLSPHDMWSWLPSTLKLERIHHYNTKRISTQYCSFSKKAGSAEWMALHRDEDFSTRNIVVNWAVDGVASGPVPSRGENSCRGRQAFSDQADATAASKRRGMYPQFWRMPLLLLPSEHASNCGPPCAVPSGPSSNRLVVLAYFSNPAKPMW